MLVIYIFETAYMCHLNQDGSTSLCPYTPIAFC